MDIRFKNINGNMQSITPFKLYKTWNLVDDPSNNVYTYTTTIASGLLDVYDGKANYNLNLYNKYSNFIESGSIWYSIRNLFYGSSSLVSGVHFTAYGDEFKIKSPLTGSALVISIPQKMFGEGIVPGTFYFTNMSGSSTITVTDDEYGDLLNSSNAVVGNISYLTGLVIFTHVDYYTQVSNSLFAHSESIAGNMNYTSYYTSYQHEYICDVKSYEFNNTSNPTAFTYNSDGKTKIFKFSNVLDASGSQVQFKPLVTGITLCDDTGTALVAAKFAKPIRMENDMDTVFIVKYDI